MPVKHHTFVCYAKYRREQKVGRTAEARSYRSVTRRSYSSRPPSPRRSSRHPRSDRDERANRRGESKTEQARTRPEDRPRRRTHASVPAGSVQGRAGTSHRND
jgi:hypothetical protein